MSIDEDNDIKPRPEIWEMAIVGLAALLTLSGIGAAFFSFTLKPLPPAKRPPQPTEVTIGIGQGQTIHPRTPAGPDDPAAPAHHP